MAAVVADRARPSPPTGVECRVYERFPCGLETSCQPVAARGDKDISWQARIRDISVGGVGLLLERRFERGTGLAVEIPATDSRAGDTLLVRVVHATRFPEGQWLLGCVLISPLSEEELETLLRISGAAQEPDRPHKTAVVQEVTWEGWLPGGRVGARMVRRLFLTGSWPLKPGTRLNVWVGEKTARRTARVEINQCYSAGGGWTVNYRFLEKPSRELLRWFGFAQR
jgi:hypothetical protein